MKKYTLIINKGEFPKLNLFIKFLNESELLESENFLKKYRNYIYVFQNFTKAKKFLKETEMVHFYVVQITQNTKK